MYHVFKNVRYVFFDAVGQPSIAGPTVWNSLPDSLRDPAVGPDQFRRDLKTHLFE